MTAETANPVQDQSANNQSINAFKYFSVNWTCEDLLIFCDMCLGSTSATPVSLLPADFFSVD